MSNKTQLQQNNVGLQGILEHTKKLEGGQHIWKRYSFTKKQINLWEYISATIDAELQIPIDGVNYPFKVVHIGNPVNPSLYSGDFSNKIWLMPTKGLFKKQMDNELTVNYVGSDIDTFLNTDFLDLLPESIRIDLQNSNMVFPYQTNTDNGATYANTVTHNGTDGIRRKVILPSCSEIGKDTNDGGVHDVLNQGSKMDYFVTDSSSSSQAVEKRKTFYINGGITRTPVINYSSYRNSFMYISSGGNIYGVESGNSVYNRDIHPLLILSKDVAFTTQTVKTFEKFVSSNDETKYPEEGISTDGYYYSKVPTQFNVHNGVNLPIPIYGDSELIYPGWHKLKTDIKISEVSSDLGFTPVAVSGDGTSYTALHLYSNNYFLIYQGKCGIGTYDPDTDKFTLLSEERPVGTAFNADRPTLMMKENDPSTIIMLSRQNWTIYLDIFKLDFSAFTVARTKSLSIAGTNSSAPILYYLGNSVYAIGGQVGGGTYEQQNQTLYTYKLGEDDVFTQISKYVVGTNSVGGGLVHLEKLSTDTYVCAYKSTQTYCKILKIVNGVITFVNQFVIEANSSFYGSIQSMATYFFKIDNMFAFFAMDHNKTTNKNQLACYILSIKNEQITLVSKCWVDFASEYYQRPYSRGLSMQLAPGLIVISNGLNDFYSYPLLGIFKPLSKPIAGNGDSGNTSTLLIRQGKKFKFLSGYSAKYSSKKAIVTVSVFSGSSLNESPNDDCSVLVSDIREQDGELVSMINIYGGKL